MATATHEKVNKTAFLTDFLGKNPKANSRAVNEAWTNAGNAGTVSPTLVSKLRGELGLSGNIRSGSRSARARWRHRVQGQVEGSELKEGDLDDRREGLQSLGNSQDPEPGERLIRQGVALRQPTRQRRHCERGVEVVRHGRDDQRFPGEHDRVRAQPDREPAEGDQLQETEEGFPQDQWDDPDGRTSGRPSLGKDGPRTAGIGFWPRWKGRSTG